jgi:pilus assembly protein Flp/PilA
MRIFKARKGATLVEYGVMVGLVSVITIAAVALTGREVTETLETSGTAIESASVDAPESEAPAGEIMIEAGSLATTNTVGGTYDSTATAVGVGSYVPGSITWSIVSGNLPDGLALTPITGRIQGSPTQIEVATFTLQATDGTATDTQEFTITIN